MQRQTAPSTDNGYRRDEAIQAAERAKTVLDHPGWIEFERNITDEIAKVTALREGVANRLLNSLENTVALESIRYQLRHIDGLLIGLKFAIEIIPGAIARGNEAAGVQSRVAAS